MFRQVRVPVLGIVENMSYLICDQCGKRNEILRHGGGKRCAEELDVPFLGEIPIDPQIAVQGDAGDPLVHSHPDRAVSKAYLALATTVREGLVKTLTEIKTPPTVEL